MPGSMTSIGGVEEVGDLSLTIKVPFAYVVQLTKERLSSGSERRPGSSRGCLVLQRRACGAGRR